MAWRMLRGTGRALWALEKMEMPQKRTKRRRFMGTNLWSLGLFDLAQMNKISVQGVDEQVIGFFKTFRRTDGGPYPDQDRQFGDFTAAGPDMNIPGKKEVIAYPFKRIDPEFGGDIGFAFINKGVEVSGSQPYLSRRIIKNMNSGYRSVPLCLDHSPLVRYLFAKRSVVEINSVGKGTGGIQREGLLFDAVDPGNVPPGVSGAVGGGPGKRSGYKTIQLLIYSKIYLTGYIVVVEYIGDIEGRQLPVSAGRTGIKRSLDEEIPGLQGFDKRNVADLEQERAV